MGRRRERLYRFEALSAEDDDFSRLDVAHVRVTDRIEGECFRAGDVGVAEPADDERAEPVRVADADHPVLRHYDEREGAANLRDGVNESALDGGLRRSGEQMDHDLAVASRL